MHAHLDVRKPPMRQCLVRREPLRGIKVRQSTNEIFEVLVNILLPQREGLSKGRLVEAAAKESEDLAPRAIAKMRQEPIQPVFIRRVKGLTFKDYG